MEKMIDENWDILGRSTSTKKIWDQKVVKGYRRPKNLRYYLVRVRTDYNPFLKEKVGSNATTQ